MLADYVIVLLKHEKEVSQLEQDLRKEISFFLPKDGTRFCDALFGEIQAITHGPTLVPQVAAPPRVIPQQVAPAVPSAPKVAPDHQPRRSSPRRQEQQEHSPLTAKEAVGSNGGSNESMQVDWGSTEAPVNAIKANKERKEETGNGWSVPQDNNSSLMVMDNEDQNMQGRLSWGGANGGANSGDRYANDNRDGMGDRRRRRSDRYSNGTHGGRDHPYNQSGGGRRRYDQDDNHQDDDQNQQGGGRGRRFDSNGGGGPDRGFKRFNRSNNNNQHQNNQQQQRRQIDPSKKVQMVNIPEEFCTEESVRPFFQKFGQIVNIVVYPLESRAIVEFSNLFESTAAHHSTEAPFNNRFVKIYWFHDQSSSSAAHQHQQQQQPKKEITAEERHQKLEEQRQLKEQLAAQMAELQRRQLEQRQELISKLEKVNEKDRDEIMGSLRTVTQSIVGAQLAHSNAERLLKTSGHFAGGAGDLVEKVGGHEDLQMKLDALKAEHSALGLGGTPRGRGRGGTAYGARGAGRGAGGTKTFRLDLRPRQLKVVGFTAQVKQPQLRSHLEQFGHVENFYMADDVSFAIVKYSQRWEAEQALKRGAYIEGGDEVSQLQMEWNTDQLPETFVRPHETSDFQMDLEDEEEEMSPQHSK